MYSDSAGSLAVVVGAGGGIGAALVDALHSEGGWGQVMGLGRGSDPPLDLTAESTVLAAARAVASTGLPLRLFINAAGILGRDGGIAEKSLQQIDALAMQRVFAVNTLGPALLLKHFLPLLPAEGRSVFACLSARVGSIGDNRPPRGASSRYQVRWELITPGSSSITAACSCPGEDQEQSLAALRGGAVLSSGHRCGTRSSFDRS